MITERASIMTISTVKLIAKVSSGNPGAVTVLSQLYREYFMGGWFDRFLVKLDATETKGLNLWLIFKDECGGNLHKAQEMFDEWLREPGLDSLGHWIVAKGLRSAPEAKYYLDQEDSAHG